jgi:RNA polymerase sigma factor for flagellar operon FliA
MRSIEERNGLVVEHLKLAKRLTDQRYKTVHRSVLYGDLLSAAYAGLLDAAERYNEVKANPQSKKPFEAYASRRIIGEMNDYLRSCNWGTRNHPQYLLSLEREAYQNNGQGQSGDVEHVARISDLCVADERSVVDELNGEELFNKVIRSLPKREKKVFRLRYLYGLTMKEVADLVGISESRVSQILSQNTEYLRGLWSERADELWEEVTQEEC